LIYILNDIISCSSICFLYKGDNDVDDDGEGEFQVKKKRNKKLKEKATAVLKGKF